MPILRNTLETYEWCIVGDFRWGLLWTNWWICVPCTNLCMKILGACGPLIY